MSYTFSFEQLEKAGCSFRALGDLITRHTLANKKVQWRKDGTGVDLNSQYLADMLFKQYGVKPLY